LTVTALTGLVAAGVLRDQEDVLFSMVATILAAVFIAFVSHKKKCSKADGWSFWVCAIIGLISLAGIFSQNSIICSTAHVLNVIFWLPIVVVAVVFTVFSSLEFM